MVRLGEIPSERASKQRLGGRNVCLLGGYPKKEKEKNPRQVVRLAGRARAPRRALATDCVGQAAGRISGLAYIMDIREAVFAVLDMWRTYCTLEGAHGPRALRPSEGSRAEQAGGVGFVSRRGKVTEEAGNCKYSHRAGRRLLQVPQAARALAGCQSRAGSCATEAGSRWRGKWWSWWTTS